MSHRLSPLATYADLEALPGCRAGAILDRDAVPFGLAPLRSR